MTLRTLKRELWYQFQGIKHRIGLNSTDAVPHVDKRNLVRRYGREYRVNILVETGTYLGDMVAAQRRQFREIYSIELGKELHDAARQRFSRNPHVHLFHGDSATILPHVLRAIKEPALFWLDAHYSGGITSGNDEYNPVLHELALIFDHEVAGHVILIDDARLFNGENGYPTVDQVTSLVHAHPGYQMTIAEDTIRLVPGSRARL